MRDKFRTTDKCGREIVAGAYVVYGHALGRCAGLRIGKVLAVTDALDWDGEDVIGKHFRVIGMEDDLQGRLDLPAEWTKLKLCKRVGTLQFADRIIVLDPDQVPSAYRALLDAYEGK